MLEVFDGLWNGEKKTHYSRDNEKWEYVLYRTRKKSYLEPDSRLLVVCAARAKTVVNHLLLVFIKDSISFDSISKNKQTKNNNDSWTEAQQYQQLT